GAIAAGLVVHGRISDGAFAGSAQSGSGRPNEYSRPCRWQLALALSRRLIVRACVSMAAGVDGSIQAILRVNADAMIVNCRRLVIRAVEACAALLPALR